MSVFGRKQLDNHLKDVLEVRTSHKLGLELAHVLQNATDVVDKVLRHEPELAIVHGQQHARHKITEAERVCHHFLRIQSDLVGSLHAYKMVEPWIGLYIHVS
jgi:hypothetical protein